VLYDERRFLAEPMLHFAARLFGDALYLPGFDP
jgi:hypothetical protein